jgi:hypothetical protein
MMDPSIRDGTPPAGGVNRSPAANPNNRLRPVQDRQAQSPAAPPVPIIIGPEPEEGGLSMADGLVGALGLPLTRHNPVWGPFALDKLRELQHVLMKHAFVQAEDQRQPVLNAVKTVEVAVTLRLRLEEALQQEALMLQDSVTKPAPEEAHISALVAPVTA